MTLNELRLFLDRIENCEPGKEFKLCIRVNNVGGLTAHQTVPVNTVYAGVDWENGKIIIQSEKELSILTEDEKKDITESVKRGNSWHQFQREKKLLDRIKELEKIEKRYNYLKNNSEEVLLNPRTSTEFMDLRTHWKFPIVICSGPIGGYLEFDEAIDVLIK